jgi:hypothetical protein
LSSQNFDAANTLAGLEAASIDTFLTELPHRPAYRGLANALARYHVIDALDGDPIPR